MNGACKKGNSPCELLTRIHHCPTAMQKNLAMTDLSQDTRVGTLTQSQQLNENKETLLPCSATTDKQCAMRRVARQNTCRAKHMASNTMPHRKGAHKQNTEVAYHSALLLGLIQHDRPNAGEDSNVETKRCFLCATTRSNVLHDTPRKQQT